MHKINLYITVQMYETILKTTSLFNFTIDEKSEWSVLAHQDFSDKSEALDILNGLCHAATGKNLEEGVLSFNIGDIAANLQLSK